MNTEISAPAKEQSVVKYQVWELVSSLSSLLMEIYLIALLIWWLVTPEHTFLRVAGAVSLALLSAYVPAKLLHDDSLRAWFRQTVTYVTIAIGLWICLALLIPALATLNPIRWISNFAGMLFRDGSLIFSVLVLLLGLGIYRGVLLVHKPATRYDILNRLSVGVLLISIVVGVTMRNNLGSALLFFTSYLLLGLIGLNASRINGLVYIFGGRLPAFKPSYAVTTIVFSLVLIFLAVSFGWLSSTFLANALLQIVIYGLYAILFGTLLVMSPILLIIMWIIRMLLENKSLELPEEEIQPAADFLQDMTQETVNNLSWLKDLLSYGRVALILAVLAILVISTILLVRKRRQNAELAAQIDDNRSASVSRVPLFGALLDRLPQLINLRGMLQTVRIRRAYAKLLNISTRLGKPRDRALTPAEFLPQLEELFPGNVPELRLITDAYNQIRYGEIPEDSSLAEQVESRLASVEASARLMMKARKRIKKMPGQ